MERQLEGPNREQWYKPEGGNTRTVNWFDVNYSEEMMDFKDAENAKQSARGE
jgi:hypothetical protein